ncbi:Holliday junction resolvase RuvX [Nitratireductor sp. XY-223]|uniref:Holliday junction resolvase RuvX n=1 Tax=Nitratireductor sp. XY-223 TaxID=2561926 RepID=UPI0010AAB932|nr:Holliday junction resolvase RuvX [Nitratireductor sp. XY-223]
MGVKSLQELAEDLPEGMVLAGLDLGTKTIGIAVSDLGLSLATPREVLRRTRFTKDADKLLELLEAERVGGCVIGLPVNMDGSHGPRAQATRAFVRNLEARTDLGFAFWDERLSTVAAERALLEMDVSRKKRAQRIDAAAAAFILQGALDRLSSLSTGNSE